MIELDRPIAPARSLIPPPEGISRDHETCAVALEVILASLTADGGLEPEQQVPWVAWGAGQSTLDQLLRQAFRPPAQGILRGELADVGELDPTCPLRLERRTAFASARLFVEALILPVGARQAAELSAILRSGGGAQARHEAGLAYVRELEEDWAARCPAHVLPRLDLRRDFVRARALPEPGETSEPPSAPDAVDNGHTPTPLTRA